MLASVISLLSLAKPFSSDSQVSLIKPSFPLCDNIYLGRFLLAKFIIRLVVAKNCCFGGSVNLFLELFYEFSLFYSFKEYSARARSLPVISVVLTPCVLLKTLNLS